jgi:hypothetical protein
MTDKIINIILTSPKCISSIKSVGCNDYEARFGAFIRVKHGIIMSNLIDWTEVAKQINNEIKTN